MGAQFCSQGRGVSVVLSVIRPNEPDAFDKMECRTSYGSHDQHVFEVAEMIAADRETRTYEASSQIGDLFEIRDSGMQDPPNTHLAVHRKTGMVRRLFTLRKPSGEEPQERLRLSVQQLQALRCDGIARVLEVFEDCHSMSLVMEHCSGGTVYDRILQRQYFAEQETAVLIRHMLQALSALHRSGLSHGLLQPDSFRFSGEQAHASLKLVDFGLEMKVHMWDVAGAVGPRLPVKARRTACLQLFETCRIVFSAPEVVKPLQARWGRKSPIRQDAAAGAAADAAFGQDFGVSGTMEPADIWSLGAITFLLLCGYPPFFAPCRHAILARIDKTDFAFDPPFWSKISEEAKDFVQHCLRVPASRRMTAAEALNHPWIQSLADTSPSGSMLSSFALNLRRFYRTSLIEGFAANSLAAKLNFGDTHDLFKRCCEADAGRSGFLTATDLRQILSALGHSEISEAIGMCFSRALRHPGESYIDYVALVESVKARRDRLLEEELWQHFCMFDPVGAHSSSMQLISLGDFLQVPEVQQLLMRDGIEDLADFAECVRYAAQAGSGGVVRKLEETGRDSAAEVSFLSFAAGLVGQLPAMPLEHRV